MKDTKMFTMELLASCQDMAARLYDVAGDDLALQDSAAFVQRAYVRALAPAVTESVRTQYWRRFITDLRAFLALRPTTQSSASLALHHLVAENADLLEELKISA